ncbi:MAG: N-acetylneuraminate synthase [Dehalobacterium sp.]
MDKVFIIAEAGVNHNGSLNMALQLVDVAVAAGVDAIKFQTFKAEKLVNKTAPKAEYQVKTTDEKETQFDMIKKLELDETAHKQLSAYCAKKGIQFLSTPFDLDSVDFLAYQIGVPRLKISSGDITNGPLLLKAAGTDKPIILSTGMSTLEEIEAALGVLAFGYIRNKEKPCWSSFQEAYYSSFGQKVLKQKVVLLHCTTEYPAPIEDVNHRAIEVLKTTFGLPVGFSDHTEGIVISIAAVAMGAEVIEKHFTLDQSLPGPDHKASLEPQELKDMVASIRQVERAFGSAKKAPSKSEIRNIPIVRKSLVAARDIKEGDIFTEDSFTVKRPGNGVSPMEYWHWLGRVAHKDYDKDEVIE